MIKNIIYSSLIGMLVGFLYLVNLIYFDISWRASVSAIVSGIIFFVIYVYLENKTKPDNKPTKLEGEIK